MSGHQSDALSDFLSGVDGRALQIEVDRPLNPSAARLMDALGVQVVIRSHRRATEGLKQSDLPGYSTGRRATVGPYADWIDHRASLSNAVKRVLAGEVVARCAGCTTEIDVDRPAHAPTCPTVTADRIKPASEWKSDEVIRAFRAWAARHDGRAPAKDDWNTATPEHPRWPVVESLFGSWRDGVTAAGLEPRRAARATPPAVPARESEAPGSVARESRKKWTRETILASFRRWADAHDGEPPCAGDWQSTGGQYPPTSACMREFGSWNEAVAAAGFAPIPRGNRRRAKVVSELARIAVEGTALSFESPELALAEAERIERDGREAAAEAKASGQPGLAGQALEAADELAAKIREAIERNGVVIRDMGSTFVGYTTPPVKPEPEPEPEPAFVPVPVPAAAASLPSPLDAIAELPAEALIACGRIMQEVGRIASELSHKDRACVARVVVTLLEPYAA